MSDYGSGLTLDVSLSSSVFADSELPAITSTVSTMFDSAAHDLGLPGEWTVRIGLHPDVALCRVRVDAEPLLLSSRRHYRVAAGVCGHELAPGAERRVDSYLIAQAGELGAEGRIALITELVCSHVLANLANLVQAGSRSGQLIPSQRGHGADPIWPSAQLGVAPVRLADSTLLDTSPERDPFLACENVLQELGIEEEAPVIEMNEETLRRLTTSPNLERAWSQNPPGPSTTLGTSMGIATALWSVFGIPSPGFVLSVDPNLPTSRYRFRFGEIVTSPYLLLPDDVVALTCADPDTETAIAMGWTLDPVGGGWWPLVATDWARTLPEPQRAYFDSVGLMMRTLFSEMQARLARWSSATSALDEVTLLREPLASDLRRLLPAVVRWLLADGVSVAQPGPVVEGVARALASGDRSTKGAIAAARRQIGGAVLGYVPPEHPVAELHLDPVATEAAATSGSVQPLLDAHQELLFSTLSLVAVCPREHRIVVAGLLRPLGDAVRVVSPEEIADAVVRLPETQGV
ncbi:MAG: hypothetical protein ABIR34_00860 [Marmoricola sp.]